MIATGIISLTYNLLRTRDAVVPSQVLEEDAMPNTLWKEFFFSEERSPWRKKKNYREIFSIQNTPQREFLSGRS